MMNYTGCCYLFLGAADVHAMLLSDVLVFLQEKDQKYVFASLVSSTLQKIIDFFKYLIGIYSIYLVLPYIFS